MGTVPGAEWPWAFVESWDADEEIAVATRTVALALRHLGEVQVRGVAIGPWRESRIGTVATLIDGDDRLTIRWIAQASPLVWPAGRLVGVRGRWAVEVGTLVLDADEIVQVLGVDPP